MLKFRYGGWLRHVFVINRALKRGILKTGMEPGRRRAG